MLEGLFPPPLTFTICVEVNILVGSQQSTGDHLPQEQAVVRCMLAAALDPCSFGGNKLSVRMGRKPNAN